ncbi:MAG: DUF192 domain-containing protein [Chloroflexi bacterium]|nr:DUF192 domain-containing protein [Chloroflexota bacterium]
MCKIFFTGLLGAVALLVAGCGASPAAPDAQPTPALASPTPVAITGGMAASPSATVIPTSVAAASATSTVVQAAVTPTEWVPPTSLAGTPIAGAEATLTAAPSLPTESLVITNSRGLAVNMRVEIASSEADRELGLMFRSSLPQDAGMLFDFGLDTTGGFWMQNTILPLSIAFIQSDGKIIDVKDMQPLDTTTVNASGPYRYALETNQGFFAAHDITPGNQVTLLGVQSALLPGMPSCTK